MYNGGPYIAACIQSVIDQSFEDWALYVVDDASTDDSPQTVAAFGDPRIRLTRNAANLGQAGNWNRCMELARGEYVKLLCADDALAPGCLQRQVSALDEHPTSVIVAGLRRVILSNGWVAKRRHGLGPLRGLVPGRDALSTCVRDGVNYLGEPPAVLMRRDALPSSNPWRPEAGYWLDFDLWARLLTEGDLVAQHDLAADFRVHAKSDSAALFRDRQVDDAAALFTRLAADPTTGISIEDAEEGVHGATTAARRRRNFYRAMSAVGFK